MKKILLQVPSPMLGNNKLFSKEIEVNNQNDIWRALKRRFSELGYEVKTADANTLDNCEKILFIDSMGVDGLNISRGGIKANIKNFFGIKTPRSWPVRALYREAIEKGMRDKLVLFLWEGKAVNPHNYIKETWDKFDHIFTWNDDLVDNKKFFKFYLPTPTQKRPDSPLSFSEKKLLVNISRNIRSTDRNELYSERRKTIQYFDSHYPHDFDLFGLKWHQPVTRMEKLFPWLIKKYVTHQGMCGDKIEVLSRYKFALCYENLKGEKGYITEKIFDALIAGTVPIYWGASNIHDYVDQKAFIDRRKFKNNKDLANYLINLKEKEYNEMLRAGQGYLQSEKFKKFSPEYFCDNIIKTLKIKNNEKYS